MVSRSVAFFAFVLVGVLPASAQVPEQDHSHGVREFTESGTWRVPPGVTRLTIEIWGAGGGGAGGGSAAVGSGPGGGGGGGGSGAYVRTSIRVNDSQIFTIRIGRGGAGGVGESRKGTQSGEDGEDTVILLNETVVLVASGGRGGGAPRRGDYRGGPGGAGAAAEPTETRLVRPGNAGTRGHDGGFSEGPSTPGGNGGAAVLGTLQPPGSLGGAGGAGMHFAHSEDGNAGGAGSVVITW